MALPLGNYALVACNADRRGDAGKPSSGARIKEPIKNIPSFTHCIGIKDIVKDTLWTMSFMLGNGYGNGAVVGAVDVGRDVGFFNTLHIFLDDEEVVDAPADISVACTGNLVPI